jgi:hypothetical protein
MKQHLQRWHYRGRKIWHGDSICEKRPIIHSRFFWLAKTLLNCMYFVSVYPAETRGYAPTLLFYLLGDISYCLLFIFKRLGKFLFLNN